MVITGRAVRVVGAIPADPAMENRFTVLRAWEGIHAALVHRERSSRNAASRLGVQRAGSWKRTSGLRGRSPGSARRRLEDVLEAFRERGVLLVEDGLVPRGDLEAAVSGPLPDAAQI